MIFFIMNSPAKKWPDAVNSAPSAPPAADIAAGQGKIAFNETEQLTHRHIPE
jgi:hypothetical protein